MIRVMITDDHLIVREGLRLILETADDIEVVGEAVDGAECLELTKKLNPQVILMDLQMPRMDGITAIERLRKDFPAIAIVILTTYNEDDLMIRGLQAGARGYLLKDSSRESLLDTIRAAAKGRRPGSCDGFMTPSCNRRRPDFKQAGCRAGRPALLAVRAHGCYLTNPKTGGRQARAHG